MILFIYGASSAGLEIYDLAKRVNNKKNKYSKIILIDDYQEEIEYYGTHRIHFSSCKKIAKDEKYEFIIAVGEPSARRLLADRIRDNGYALATLVDDTAIVCDTAIISSGCIVNAGAVISSNVRLDENCIVMYHAIVGHDAHVKRDTVICPKATVGGKSVVGEQCFLGISSSMKQEVDIADKAIGMGSMVFRNVENGATVVGNPARVTKGNNEHKVFV
jgi:sugar O-acyltransferase (sialic acid O-acetyltransferase NeuD family)